MRRLIIALTACFLSLSQVAAQDNDFSKLVGGAKAKPVAEKDVYDMPWITWGGDVITFSANGGSAKTTPTSVFGKMGLRYNLVDGNNPAEQVKKYMAGETPWLRMTIRMLGQASGVLGSDPSTQPVVLLQETFSLGDHVVAREHVASLNDLKPKEGKKLKIAVQRGGPHVGLIDDMLRTAKLKWEDVEIVWTEDLSGAKGPAELFKKDKSIDLCCVITPDMLGLTGGLDQTGSGAEGTIKGSHVVSSTSTMSRSVVDVVCVRADYFKTHREECEKFVAGYLKAARQVQEWRKKTEDSGTMPTEYKKLLTVAQGTFGRDVIPTIEVDGHGLMLDANIVGLTGNIAFFEQEGNLNGFEAKQKVALDLAVGQKYATARRGFQKPGFDYRKIATLAGLEYVAPKVDRKRIAESVDLFPDSDTGDGKGKQIKVIYTFEITFSPNQTTFSADTYGAQFDEAIKNASLYGNAAIRITGHSDPTKTLVDMIRAGMKKGIIKRTGNRGSYKYFLSGRPLDLTQTKTIQKMIETGTFDGADDYDPKATMQAALNLSHSRARSVRTSLISYAKTKGYNFDESQFRPVGAGVTMPVIPKPRNLNEAKQNMRVQFQIVTVPAEALNPSDFDDF